MTSLLQKRDGSAPYTFFSRPRPVQQKTSKYRDDHEPDVQILYGNIMYDRRIIRGNTYAQNTLSMNVQPDPVEAQKQQEIRRLALARKRAKQILKSQTPEPVEGRKHIDVQTELYLEELTDRVEEADIFTQTDTFLDRPPTPLFIPAKSGVDVSTQILDGELFDFNIEVKPILEVLIGKTVEQSLMEVMEEEELDNLRAQQRRFEELRFAELIETQRLEEQEKRHREEKERRIRQQLEVMKKEKETIEKIAAHTFAQSYLQDLIPSVFTNLHEHGFFYDPVEQDVEAFFMPFLMENVVYELNKSLLARAVLDSIIKETVIKRSVTYMNLDAEVEKRIHATNIPLNSSLNGTLSVSADGTNGPEYSKEVGKEPNPTVTFNEEGLKDTEKVDEMY
uniref:Radial spoke head protein 3 homolog n=1 Tax=Hydra vulgaris TaxID=6087 RepID=T2MB47_HYDVU